MQRVIRIMGICSLLACAVVLATPEALAEVSVRTTRGGEYVETVSVVSRIVNLDVFARGIGVPPRALPSAAVGRASAAARVIPTAGDTSTRLDAERNEASSSEFSE